jgi:hypothetical protein
MESAKADFILLNNGYKYAYFFFISHAELLCGLNSADPRDPIKMRICGVDFLDSVVDHRGCVNGIPRRDIRISFQKFQRTLHVL